MLAYLDLSIARRIFYNSKDARRSLFQAVQLSGIAISVSGELGVRQKHQTKETAHLFARSRVFREQPRSIYGSFHVSNAED